MTKSATFLSCPVRARLPGALPSPTPRPHPTASLSLSPPASRSPLLLPLAFALPPRARVPLDAERAALEQPALLRPAVCVRADVAIRPRCRPSGDTAILAATPPPAPSPPLAGIGSLDDLLADDVLDATLPSSGAAQPASAAPPAAPASATPLAAPASAAMRKKLVDAKASRTLREKYKRLQKVTLADLKDEQRFRGYQIQMVAVELNRRAKALGKCAVVNSRRADGRLIEHIRADAIAVWPHGLQFLMIGKPR